MRPVNEITKLHSGDNDISVDPVYIGAMTDYLECDQNIKLLLNV